LAEWIRKRLNSALEFEKCACFQKKWSVPLKPYYQTFLVKNEQTLNNEQVHHTFVFKGSSDAKFTLQVV